MRPFTIPPSYALSNSYTLYRFDTIYTSHMLFSRQDAIKKKMISFSWLTTCRTGKFHHSFHS